MFIIDECDEVLNNSKEILGLIINKFKEIGINPMYALFSATVDEKVQSEAECYINQPTPRIYLAEK
jgi:hypothetical protein